MGASVMVSSGESRVGRSSGRPGKKSKIIVAVASNFTSTLHKVVGELGSDFEVVVVSGSTGKLTSQIQNGAPFDLFLAADEKHIKLLETEGKLLPESHFVYALGRVAVWAPLSEGGPKEIEARLKEGHFNYVAIANPLTAPYGAAAQEILEKLQIWHVLESKKKVLRGESVAQAFHFTHSGAADVALVSLAQISEKQDTHHWEVPQHFHQPLRQAGAVVSTSAFQREAYAMIDLLRSPQSQRILKESGYGTVDEVDEVDEVEKNIE